MLASQHTIVGSAIALQTGNPLIGFFGGLLSHPLLDLMPHVDIGTCHPDGVIERFGLRDYIFVSVDAVVTVGLLGLIILKTESPQLVMAGALGGFVPDMIDYTPVWERYFHNTKFGKAYNKLHNQFHYDWKSYRKTSIILAIMLQVFITLGGLWVSSLSF